jgi:outer membrane protein TolC
MRCLFSFLISIILESVPVSHQADLLLSSVCYQTDIQYWNTVARAELVQIATDYRQSIASLVQTIRERVDVGLADPQDLLMAEVKLNEADYQLLQTQSNFDTGRMALNSLIGVDLKAETEVEDTIPTVVLSDSLLLFDGSNRPLYMMRRKSPDRRQLCRNLQWKNSLLS